MGRLAGKNTALEPQGKEGSFPSALPSSETPTSSFCHWRLQVTVPRDKLGKSWAVARVPGKVPSSAPTGGGILSRTPRIPFPHL